MVVEEKAQSILLSGGVDTSLLALAASKHYRPTGLTVVAKDAQSSDLHYAKMVANALGLNHETIEVTTDEAVSFVRPVVKITQSFDPMEVRTSVPVYAGLIKAKEKGFESIMLGYGGDELFAGYPYMINMKHDDVKRYIEYIAPVMSFFSTDLAVSVGIRAVEPFRNPKIVNLALQIDPSFKVREVDGKKYGKWILRLSLRGSVPEDVVWRQKENIGSGSGFADLGMVIGSLVSDAEYSALTSRIKARPRDREQAYYLKVLLEELGGVPAAKLGQKECPFCGGGVSLERTYCRICGAYPV